MGVIRGYQLYQGMTGDIRDTRGYQRLLWDIRGHQGISRDIRGYHGIPRDIRGYKGIPGILGDIR